MDTGRADQVEVEVGASLWTCAVGTDGASVGAQPSGAHTTRQGGRGTPNGSLEKHLGRKVGRDLSSNKV